MPPLIGCGCWSRSCPPSRQTGWWVWVVHAHTWSAPLRKRCTRVGATRAASQPTAVSAATRLVHDASPELATRSTDGAALSSGRTVGGVSCASSCILAEPPARSVQLGNNSGVLGWRECTPSRPAQWDPDASRLHPPARRRAWCIAGGQRVSARSPIQPKSRGCTRALQRSHAASGSGRSNGGT